MGNKNSRYQEKEELSDEDKALDVFIQSILEDNDLNLPMVPDGLEKKIYRNMLKFVIAATKKMLATVSVRFLGHEITFHLSPLVGF